MKISEVHTYGLHDSIVASGLPMISEYNEHVWNQAFAKFSNHKTRAAKLADNPVGSGHLTFLSGIIVQMNITATVKWWEQWQRYHFQQIVSSMSTMHRLRRMMKENTVSFNEKTSPAVIESFMNLLNDENSTDEVLAYSCPMGIELTARVTTNYLQLRTMYYQRRYHKLEEWRVFCSFIESLPMSKVLVTNIPDDTENGCNH